MWLWAGLVAFTTVLISLYSEDAWTWWSLGAMAALTIGLTFLLPKLHRPAAPPAPPPPPPSSGPPGPPSGPVSLPEDHLSTS
jgi:hypothetical protein